MSYDDQQTRSFWGRLYDGLIGFIYPPQCVICDSLHEGGNFFICPGCEKSLQIAAGPVCLRCRNPIPPEEDICNICGGKPTINRVWYLGAFDDYYRPLIHAFKYSGIIPVGKYLSRRLADSIEVSAPANPFEAVIPIPLHPSRQRKRGFNQSQLMAKILARKLEIEYLSDNLIRIKKTRDQTGLNQRQRIDNMRGAFAIKAGAELKAQSVLLVDDVTTTGATALEAARVLKAGGISRVSLAVIAAAGMDTQEPA